MAVNAMLAIVLALLIGACMPVQAGINSLLRANWAGDPALAAFVSFFVGTLALLGYCLAARVDFPSLAAAGHVKWWQWLGGFLGAYVVGMSIHLVPRLGAATLMALVVAGQMFASLLLDHNAMLGYPERLASPLRLLGAALIVAGVVLVRKF